jgi:hypothetical protein
MNKTWLSVVLGSCVAIILPACGSDEAVDPGPPPAELRIDGTYQVVSTYDLSVASVLPEPVSEYAQVAVGLRTDPAGTMFKLLDDAGVPLASDLFAALPDVVANQIKGWMNDFFASEKYGDGSVKSELDAFDAALQTVVARPDVASRLDLGVPDARGAVTATHALEGLRYSLYGGQVKVTVPITTPAGSGAPIVTEASAAGRVTAGLGAEDAHLSLDDHGFGIPYGTFALAALDQGLEQRYGTDLRGMLGLLVDCDGMAASVAGRCVLGACVGHESDLASICESALDLANDQLRGQVADLRLDVLRLQAGQAAMWDAPTAGAARDQQVDRIDGGVWNALVDFGMGARDVHGTFVASRAQ